MTPGALSAASTACAASLVEFTEALTVVLAVASVRGHRSAVAGVLCALAGLVTLVAVCGPVLHRAPAAAAQVACGTLLVLVGTRWLRKATLRAAGAIPLRDEDAAFRRHRARIALSGAPAGRWDGVGVGLAFQATAIEGLEVVFIVVAIGGGGPGLLAPAAAGATAALCGVAILGVALHRPISRIPENTLKRLVGAMLAGLGTYWVGDGAGLCWPGEEAWIVLPGVGFLILSAALSSWFRHAGRSQPP